MLQIKHSSPLTFSRTINNPYVPKKIRFLKLTTVLRKYQPKCGVLRLLLSLLVELALFRNYIPNKKVKFKYGEASWINKNTKSALRKRSRLTKRYYVKSSAK